MSYKKLSPEEIEKNKEQLDELQRKVTQEDYTESPFSNKYNDHKEDGIYVDVVSGEPLFCSLDKYDAGCGWPSFMKPIDNNQIVEKEDLSIPGRPRVEIRSSDANSHLGHVFDDGPGATGQRFCLNSAAMKFIAKNDMENEGYGYLLHLFT